MLQRLQRAPNASLVRQFVVPKVVCRRRWISSYNLNDAVKSVGKELAQTQPLFRLAPRNVNILTQPRKFYEKLLDMISRAEKRIFISSLYIGSEEKELISAIYNRLKATDDLQLHLLLDYNRSTRPGPESTARLLLPLLQDFPSRVKISMFRSPSLRGLMARLVPPRFNEGWGTWHAKIYGADDEVMISGANLNQSYFENRQDRYIHFSKETQLAQYCYDYMDTASQFSFNLLPAPSHTTNNNTHDDYTLQWPLEKHHPHHFNSYAEQAFTELQGRYQRLTSESSSAVSDEARIMIFPIMQAGQFNIREEESFFKLLFKHLRAKTLSRRPVLDFTSGYFSIFKSYRDLILNSRQVDTRIVAAAPKANGFFGSRGMSGRIPEGYTLYEQRFMKAVACAGRTWQGQSDGQGGVSLREWEKAGWTYHAKGIWLSPGPSSPPVLTLFGSTNLNARSAHIDTELSFVMIIPSEESTPAAAAAVDETRTTTADGDKSLDSACVTLRQDLAKEIEGIRSNTTEWKGGRRRVRWTTKFMVWLVKGML